MSRRFCFGKKDFCDDIEGCRFCEFADGSGSVSEDEISLVLSKIFGEDYSLDRLKELVEADRNGRCVVLPCRVGDTLYYIGGTYKTLIKPVTVEEVYIGDGVFAVGVSSGFTTFTLQEKEWYKSKKEAEAALERMEGEEK